MDNAKLTRNYFSYFKNFAVILNNHKVLFHETFDIDEFKFSLVFFYNMVDVFLFDMYVY